MGMETEDSCCFTQRVRNSTPAPLHKRPMLKEGYRLGETHFLQTPGHAPR